MNKEETIKRILSERNITDEDLEFLAKILDLETDAERVEKVHINQWFGGPFYCTVDMKKSFADLEEFKKYLQAHGLPAENAREYTRSTEKKDYLSFSYKPRDINVRFYEKDSCKKESEKASSPPAPIT